MSKERGIDDMLKELEEMAKEMEGGKLSLEESFDKYENAMKVLKEVNSSLGEVEDKIMKLQNGTEVPADPEDNK